MTSAWPEAALGEVADINPKVAFTLQPHDRVAFVPMASVDAVRGAVENAEVRAVASLTSGLTPFMSGDVLVAKITPCFENGKIAHAFTDTSVGYGSTEFHVVRGHPGRADQRYVFHYLRQPWVRAAGERRMTGSAGQRRVPADFLQHLRIPLPAIEEQRRIAAILDAADSLRAKRRETLGLLDSLTTSIFLDMFGDPLANPRGWRRVPLADLLDKIDSGKSPVCLDRRVEGEEWGVLKLGAVTWGNYNDAENKALPPSVTPDPALEVKPGDLLFTRKNTRELVGASAYVYGTRSKLLLSDLIFRLRIRPGAALPQFLHRLLSIPSKRREIQMLAGGSAGSMPNISKARLAAALVELPPLERQAEYVVRAEALRGVTLTCAQEMRELDNLFASLQLRSFSGAV